MSGIPDIPLRIPLEWDPVWFAGIYRDVFANADVRNATGIGIEISGNPDVVATLTGASADAGFITISATANLTNERVLAVETGVLTLIDNGAGLTVEIGVATSGISFAKIQDVSAADKVLGRSTAGAGVIEEITMTSAGRALMDDANATAQRVTLGLVIGTDVQAFDATLLSLAALGTAADKMAYTTALDVWAETTITAAGRALLDDASASAQRTTLSAAARSQVVDKQEFIDIQDGDGDYVIHDDIGYGLEIDSINACLLHGGVSSTATVTLKINSTTIGGISVSADDTTKQTTADESTSASTMVATDELVLNIASQSGDPVSISFVIHGTRTFA